MKKIVKIVTEGAWAIVNCKDTYTGRSRFSCSSCFPARSDTGKYNEKLAYRSSTIPQRCHCAGYSREKLERNIKVLIEKFRFFFKS